MNSDLTARLRELGDQLAAEHEYKQCALVYQAAHRIEHLEQKTVELEGMVEDSDHFRDYWYDRYLKSYKRYEHQL